MFLSPTAYIRRILELAITRSNISPPPPLSPTLVPLLDPPHIVSQSLISIIISAHSIPEWDFVYTVIKNETDLNSLPVKLSNILTRLVIAEGVCNDVQGDVVIEGLNCLESLLVKENSVKNLNSLKICNCAMLERIETEKESFLNVISLEISSMIDLI